MNIHSQFPSPKKQKEEVLRKNFSKINSAYHKWLFGLFPQIPISVWFGAFFASCFKANILTILNAQDKAEMESLISNPHNIFLMAFLIAATLGCLSYTYIIIKKISRNDRYINKLIEESKAIQLQIIQK